MLDRRPKVPGRLAASLFVISLAACSSSSDAPGPSAAALVFQVPPASVEAGAAQPAPIAVGVVDGSGVPVSAAVDVTLSLSTAPVDATMLGTVTVRSVNGVASFPGLAFPRAGSYRLRAEATGLAAATSDAFDVSPGPAAALAFEAQPPSATVRSELATPAAFARDALGNVVHAAYEITLSAEDGPSALAGTTTRTAPDGRAAFPGLSLAEEGTYRLRATTPGLDPALSGTFTVVDDVPPDSPADLAATAPTPFSLQISWTATGDDGALGTAAVWELRVSTSPLTIESFDSTPYLLGAGGTTPLPAGSAAGFGFGGLDPGTTYWVGLRVWDGAGNAAYAFATATTDPCPTGYTGHTCTACADGYVAADGACQRVRPPLAEDLLITELMLSGANGRQWFEVQNLSTTYPITLEQKKVEVVGFEPQGFFLPSIVLLRGERAVIASAEIPNVAVAHMWPANFSLPLGAGRLQIRGGTTVVEEITWTVPEQSSASRQLSSAAHVKGANVHPWYWCDATVAMPDGSGDLGTPGGANGNCGVVPVPPVDWCWSFWPPSYVTTAGEATSVYVRVYEPGITNRNLTGNDRYPHLVVEAGYGAGSDATAWTWAPAEFNPAYAVASSNDDELTASLSIAAPGTYSFGFRAALREPASGALSAFTYCGAIGTVADPTAGTWRQATITAP